MTEFVYKALPWNIVFGAGALERLCRELAKLGLNGALVISTPEQQDSGAEVLQLLGKTAAGHFSDAKMHVPAATLAAATEAARRVKADCTVAIGGGSTTGLGKALAVREDLPNVAIPTSYAGSEMTDIWAITEADRKVTARDFRAVPVLTIYDPELTLSMPAPFAAVSGLNALAQAVVNVATDKPNPIVASMALEGVRALVNALPVIIADPKNIKARTDALYGASMAGAALGTGTTGLHHRLCHTFGGTFGMPHAETHAILLPHSVAFNAHAASKGTRRVASAMGVNDAALGIYELSKALGAPQALRDIGVAETDLDNAADVTCEAPIDNPETVTRPKVRTLLQNAYLGLPPDT